MERRTSGNRLVRDRHSVEIRCLRPVGVGPVRFEVYSVAGGVQCPLPTDMGGRTDDDDPSHPPAAQHLVCHPEAEGGLSRRRGGRSEKSGVRVRADNLEGPLLPIPQRSVDRPRRQISPCRRGVGRRVSSGRLETRCQRRCSQRRGRVGIGPVGSRDSRSEAKRSGGVVITGPGWTCSAETAAWPGSGQAPQAGPRRLPRMRPDRAFAAFHRHRMSTCPARRRFRESRRISRRS